MTQTQMYVMNDDEVDMVSGANATVVAIAAGVIAVAGVAKALNEIEAFGEKCGKALYNATH